MRAWETTTYVAVVAVSAAAIFGLAVGTIRSDEKATARDRRRRQAATRAALRPGAVVLVALDRPKPYPVRVAIGGRVYGFRDLSTFSRWAAGVESSGVLRAPSPRVAPLISHPSTGGEW